MNRCCVVFFCTAALCLAQSKEPNDSWLMRNYRFAPPPAPGEIRPVSPAIGQLQEIQNTTLNILRKANLAGDYEAALAAAAQATATAQLIGTLTGELRTAPASTRPAAAPENSRPPYFLIAFQDESIQEATAVWKDGLMLHYTTPRGGHEQVRLDRVDWKLSEQLNRHPQ